MDNHVILLRVNQYWESQSHNPNQPSREQVYSGNPNWLDTRLEWFETYLLENLKTQIDMGFWCFMLIDPQTPPSYKEKLYSYEKLGFIKIIENNGDNPVSGSPSGREFNKDIINSYQSIKQNTSDEIICSRIDTDDMVGPHWNVAVKNLLVDHKRISLETCLLYNLLNKETKLIKFSKGSFVSTKSTLNNFDNPRGFSHNDSNAISIDTDYPLVCMGIHDNNVTNHNWWGAGKPHPLEEEIFNQMFKIKK
tara:strand:+ start:1039 stop:1788 length:750 start_codon:yes stop_codon:yes gene_type:complete